MMTNISHNSHSQDHHYYHRATGIFSTREETEKALKALRDAGFRMENVSVIVKDTERSPDDENTDNRYYRADDIESNDEIDNREVEEAKIGNKADEGAATGAATGGALGAIAGLFVGLGTLAIPGIGPILLAGATATTIATTVAGTAIGAAAGSLIGALIGLGIPEEKAKIYSDRIARGEYLIIIDGDESSLQTAAKILKDHGIQEWSINSIPSASSSTTETSYPQSVETVEETPMVVVVDHRDEASRKK